MAFEVSAEGADWAAQPRQMSNKTRKERWTSVTRNRLSIRALKVDYLIGKAGSRLWALGFGFAVQASVTSRQPARRRSSGRRRAFIEPERKPSRSRVTNLNPRALKIRVNSAARAGSRARGNSSLEISMRTISP